jgi:hypothetical protein
MIRSASVIASPIAYSSAGVGFPPSSANFLDTRIHAPIKIVRSAFVHEGKISWFAFYSPQEIWAEAAVQSPD